MSTRFLDWEGTINTRDSGGLRAAGGVVREGALVRSDVLNDLTPAGSSALIAHGVRTVIDVRAQDEIADAWDRYPFREHALVNYRNLPFTAGHDASQMDQVRAAYGVARSREELNRLDLDSHRIGIAAIVGAIADAPPGGVLVHCHAGKDRTGMVVALTLAAVGVSDEDIADDYALTMLVIEPLIAEWLDSMSDQEEERARLRGLAEPRREAMLDTLAYLRRHYGSAAEYLLGSGVTREQLDRLRARLVAAGRMREDAHVMDEAAREYLLIGFGLDRLEAGIIDSYFGPSELRDEAAPQDGSPLSLASRATELRSRLDELTDDAQRHDWLDRQLLAMETLGQRIGGVEMPYIEEVERCFDARPEPTPPEMYAQLRQDLEDLLPGTGDLRVRLDQRDERLTIPKDRLGTIADWLAIELRHESAGAWRLPDGDDLVISLVNDQPWSAYNWYDGGLRSRIEINTDLPMRAPQLIGTLAHETFPGHHLEHAWKEARLVRERGYLEASMLLINTPEAYISEGLAEVGHKLLLGGPRWQELLLGICQRAGIELDAANTEREWRIAQALRRLRGSGADAALQLHVAKRPREDVLKFLEQDALSTPRQAEKSLDFITHPLWRTYVFCYSGGERLLMPWCEAAGDRGAQQKRYFRLLSEQLTPSAVAAEMV